MKNLSFWAAIYLLEASADRCQAIAERDSFRASRDDYDDILGASLALSAVFPSHDGVEIRAAPCAMDALARQCHVLGENETVPISWGHRHWLTDAAIQMRRDARKRRDYAAEREAAGL